MRHEHLMAITSTMPMRQIDVDGQPYLQRYYAGTTEDGGQWWYHRFLRADSERHLHTHPWRGTAMLLRGRYVEQLRPVGNITDRNDRVRHFKAGRVNEIFPETLHRIVEVEPDTWTLVYIERGRQPTWKFIADDGAETIMQASAEDWWKSCGCRPVDFSKLQFPDSCEWTPTTGDKPAFIGHGLWVELQAKTLEIEPPFEFVPAKIHNPKTSIMRRLWEKSYGSAVDATLKACPDSIDPPAPEDKEI